MNHLETKPDDFKPIGWVGRAGESSLKIVVVDHCYDQHAMGGWGYKVAFIGQEKEIPFLWPHYLLGDLHPLETLAMQAE